MFIQKITKSGLEWQDVGKEESKIERERERGRDRGKLKCLKEIK